jgi:hypothetical protein
MAAAKRREPNAATISRVLATAGFQRATRYSIYGRERHGFIVTDHVDYVNIGDSLRDRRSAYVAGPADGGLAEQVATMVTVLVAAGYNAAIDGRRIRPSVEVRTWDPRMHLWLAPSGRLHWQRMCSGGAGRRNVRTSVTRDQFEAAVKCRCVPVWKAGGVAV